MSGQQRSHCPGGGAWFGQTEGTPLDGLRTPGAAIARALRSVLRRGSLRAAEAVTRHKDETSGPWLQLAARPAEALSPVLGHDRQLSPRAGDACWSCVRSRTAPGPAPIRRRMGGPPP